MERLVIIFWGKMLYTLSPTSYPILRSVILQNQNENIHLVTMGSPDRDAKYQRRPLVVCFFFGSCLLHRNVTRGAQVRRVCEKTSLGKILTVQAVPLRPTRHYLRP